MSRPAATFLVDFCGVTCGSVLAYSGLSHLLGRSHFRDAIATHELIPGVLQGVVAAVAPVVELTVGVLLVGIVFQPEASVWAFWPASGVFLAFLVYAAALNRNHTGEECGCGGSGLLEQVSGWTTVRAAINFLVASFGAGLAVQGDLVAPQEGLAGYALLAGSAMAVVIWLLPVALAPTSLLTELSISSKGES